MRRPLAFSYYWAPKELGVGPLPFGQETGRLYPKVFHKPKRKDLKILTYRFPSKQPN